MKKTPLRDRIRYAFDNSLSAGAVALIGWLALASGILVLASATVIWVFSLAPRQSYIKLAWMLLLHTLGKSIPGSDGTGWPYLLFMLVVTIGGILITGTLIAVLTAIVRKKVDDLSHGRSKVVESGHTVILGWTPHIFSIIRELAIAKSNEPNACIVILGQQDKPTMDAALRAQVPGRGHLRIVTRRGDPIEMPDLELVSLDTAHSIIVPSPDGDDPDSDVIKTLLAITKNPRRRSEPYHIVAEIHNPKNMAVARLAARNEVELILAGDLISRIAAQTCRQPGLSAIYTELLDFSGDEIYFKEEPYLVGKTFGEALVAYEDSMPIGLYHQDGLTELHPPFDTIIRPGDEIIAIAEDDDAIRLSHRRDLQIRAEAMRSGTQATGQPEHTLLLGWNWCAPAIINELDRYVVPGSTVTVVADASDAEDKIRQHCSNLENESVEFRLGNTTDRHTLEQTLTMSYDHAIILCYCDTLDRQRADARTLVTLLHLRDIAQHLEHPMSIVSEMTDIRNRNLAEVARPDDFIVSEQLVSLLLAQISERKALNAVFADLFNPEGSEIHLRPVTDYVETGQPVNFYTVVASARNQGEIALGYRLHAYSGDAAKRYGIVLNPDKSEPVTFSLEDRIIVLTEA